MQILSAITELNTWLSQNKNPAFVPTMGALHEGHLSLVKAAKKTKKPVLVSVFVNPKQFAPNEDFDSYPRGRAGDSKKLKSAGADAVWFPTEEEVYPDQDVRRVIKEHAQNPPQSPLIRGEETQLPMVFSELEGAIRPGFFFGIAQVISRLFKIIQPSTVFFGQKDFQQTILIKWLVKKLRLPIKVIICPIIRESNGLAMSSRNEYLSVENRKKAEIIYKSLLAVKSEFNNGGVRFIAPNKEKNPKKYKNMVRDVLESEKCVDSIDYIEIRNANTLKRLKEIKKPAVLLIALRIGGIRLLDNLILE